MDELVKQLEASKKENAERAKNYKLLRRHSRAQFEQITQQKFILDRVVASTQAAISASFRELHSGSVSSAATTDSSVHNISDPTVVEEEVEVDEDTSYVQDLLLADQGLSG